jgi:DNA-directed RNA polymerase specialized sigma24 family protein
VTKRARRFQRERQLPRKIGEVHVLDNVTGADFERDETGRPRVGVAGISDPLRSLFIKAHVAWIDWEIGRANRTARMQIPLDKDLGAVDFQATWEMAGLTDSQRIAMDLIIVEGLSMQEAADLQEVSKSAIQARVNLARLKIRLCFGVPALDRGLAVRAN